jgi:23S rRNA pseudouridine2604 synthase
MRINKYLADQKISTRRGADELIKNKKVFINGKPALLGSQVNETDKVEVRGAEKTEYKYYAYHKPIGVETTAVSGVPPKAVTDSPKAGLFPLGRLDKASHGLLILTNDGRITDSLLNPKYIHEKEYLVRTKEKLRSNFKTKMEAGVNIEGYQTQKCKVKILNANTFRIILTEGKKHQIRRMCANLFQEVADLKRERIMNITLGKLAPKGIREIKGAELTIFLNQVLRQS